LKTKTGDAYYFWNPETGKTLWKQPEDAQVKEVPGPPLCTFCRLYPSNIGYPLCQTCYESQKYQQQLSKLPLCSRCNHQKVTPGYSWCDNCYKSSGHPLSSSQNMQKDPISSISTPDAMMRGTQNVPNQMNSNMQATNQNYPTNSNMQATNQNYPMNSNMQTPNQNYPMNSNMQTTNRIHPSSFNDKGNVIHFYDRGQPYFEFTNFAEYPIELDGQKWPTSEHYYQAQKFEHFPHLKEIVRNLKTAKEAYKFPRNNPDHVRKDWQIVKNDVMRKALRAKFTQHNNLRVLLLDTGSAILVEHTSNDSYWADGGNGSGKNMLGIMLMEVRAELRQSNM
jgi:ribA/ribD-fused uncharacterized protein